MEKDLLGVLFASKLEILSEKTPYAGNTISIPVLRNLRFYVISLNQIKEKEEKVTFGDYTGYSYSISAYWNR